MLLLTAKKNQRKKSLIPNPTFPIQKSPCTTAQTTHTSSILCRIRRQRRENDKTTTQKAKRKTSTHGSTPPRIHCHGATVTPSTVRSTRAHRARSDARSMAEGGGRSTEPRRNCQLFFFFLSLSLSLYLSFGELMILLNFVVLLLMIFCCCCALVPLFLFIYFYFAKLVLLPFDQIC